MQTKSKALESEKLDLAPPFWYPTMVTWLSSFVEPIHEEGYRDMFLSFSIPYGIAAIVYYISLFYEVRRANRILDEVRRKENERI